MSFMPGATLYTGSLLDTGQESVPRPIANTTSGLSNGNMRVAVFRARRSQTITQVRFIVTGNNTCTSAYIGLYTVEADGALTRRAVTDDIASSFSSTGLKTVPFLANYAVTRGSMLAVGVIGNFSSSAPSIQACVGVPQGESAALPPTALLLSGAGSPYQPGASYSAATVAASTSPTAPYFVLLPA